MTAKLLDREPTEMRRMLKELAAPFDRSLISFAALNEEFSRRQDIARALLQAAAPPSLSDARAEALEEAAQVAENFRDDNPFPTVYAAIAQRIRALIPTREGRCPLMSECMSREAVEALRPRPPDRAWCPVPAEKLTRFIDSHIATLDALDAANARIARLEHWQELRAADIMTLGKALGEAEERNDEAERRLTKMRAAALEEAAQFCDDRASSLIPKTSNGVSMLHHQAENLRETADALRIKARALIPAPPAKDEAR